MEFNVGVGVVDSHKVLEGFTGHTQRGLDGVLATIQVSLSLSLSLSLTHSLTHAHTLSPHTHIHAFLPLSLSL